ncbi:hypothetical protein O6H91_20G024600 [Diphasiastrum complanatum]|uniref:Uncharacterized protein n=3 Tax=Diphasiastrum complanatum TaxID=34168 RepID=A0ACC2ANQ3_DIPCM|nr:hypothetical protein O6H91_20G024600 [Diphasiastrum complanatum]KAJ7519136.1 hypothetical protein O6H91_20G024600 [Diphasiastrum complanatum]KAJ7519137.1 hypothetical protein O6H91_20G024600 [Diphasiastrum complanatum]
MGLPASTLKMLSSLVSLILCNRMRFLAAWKPTNSGLCNCRLGGLRSWYAASYSDQDRELVLSSRTRENLKVHRKEEPLLKDTILNSCLKKVTSKWSEIAGLDKVKESLQEGFIIPLRYPELFKGYIAIITGKRAITWLYRF